MIKLKTELPTPNPEIAKLLDVAKLPKAPMVALYWFDAGYDSKEQPQYITLPALISHDPSGVVTTRWRLTWIERLRVLLSGNLWVQMMCFHRPTTPVKVLTRQPAVWECL